MKRAWIAGVMIAAAGLSCSGSDTGNGRGSSSATQAAAPTLEELKGTEFHGIYDEPCVLTDGRWGGDPFVPGGASRPSVELVGDVLGTADLGRDGNPESVVLLAESSGGSGVQIYVAAVGRRRGKLVNLGTGRVGDRVKLRAARVGDGRIELDVVQAGPTDPACCPTQMATRSWILRDEGLVEEPPRITGTLSIADLAGVEWTLERFSGDDPAPAAPAITLAFGEGRISGSSGCNGYFGSVEESAPGEIGIGPLGATRRACPPETMALENRYLEALQSVDGYQFHLGKLALKYSGVSGTHLLLFTAGQREPED